MTSRTLSAGVLALALGGCGQPAELKSGIQAELTAVGGKTANNLEGPANAEGYQTFYTAEGKRVDLQQALLVLTPVELRQCVSVTARAARWLGELLVPSAQAHSAHAAAPSGVIDLARDDGLVWDLGEAAAPPGTYCGAELEFAVLPEGANGAGSQAFLAPCWYPDSGTGASVPPAARAPIYPDELTDECYDIALAGEIGAVSVEFSQPVVLDAAHRFASVGLRIEYDTWFDGVDIRALSTGDPQAKGKFFGNLRSSIVLAPGQGD